ncbi:SDR family NAD(P)-dependent oxidoreductase [Paraburkholderia sp. 22B1P]|uniref:SDR family NAD(P)-dependent oxidoreductase n=1 Tax=Paraburkholderia sp. 22B1P TaxID=3080498 RepID=UPI003090FD95|nr:SDR family NAD(P)-dependent oxidoreductase [Paraburkholderia sp. 22B1P]
MRLSERVVIITGAASQQGIGFAAARRMATEGATVVLLDLDEDKVASAAAALGNPHLGFACDVSDAEQCKVVARQVFAKFGRTDVLVNSAGVSQPKAALEIDAVDLARIFDVNVNGTFFMSQAVIPYMKRRSSGSIVCIGSVSAQRGGGIMGGAHYSASKGAVHSLAKSLARELAGTGIRVNAIAPGLIETGFIAGRIDEVRRAAVIADTPLGRLGTADDVAKACLYLASDMSSYVTGIVLDVNGGLLIH